MHYCYIIPKSSSARLDLSNVPCQLCQKEQHFAMDVHDVDDNDDVNFYFILSQPYF